MDDAVEIEIEVVDPATDAAMLISRPRLDVSHDGGITLTQPHEKGWNSHVRGLCGLARPGATDVGVGVGIARHYFRGQGPFTL